MEWDLGTARSAQKSRFFDLCEIIRQLKDRVLNSLDYSERGDYVGFARACNNNASDFEQLARRLRIETKHIRAADANYNTRAGSDDCDFAGSFCGPPTRGFVP